MKVLRGDIFKVGNELDYIVVPVNVGWTREGKNVMGRGIARQAANIDPSLPVWYGLQCKRLREHTPVLVRGRFIMFPVKPLLIKTPWLSWQQPASLSLIEKSLKQLQRFKRPDKRCKILIPMVGCGNGKLKPEQVLPLLHKFWMLCYRLVRR